MDTLTHKYAGLHKAASVLAGQCDGARAQDGVGYNGTDTKFGHRIAETPVIEWSEYIAVTAADVLRKYAGQLEMAGIDIRQVIADEAPELDDHEANGVLKDISEAGHREAYEKEYQRKHAPYMEISGNLLKVWNSYPIRQQLASNGFIFGRNGTKTWDSPINGTAAATILGLPEIRLNDAQRLTLSQIPADAPKLGQEQPSGYNIDVAEYASPKLVLITEFGQIPLPVTRALPGRHWDGKRKANHVNPHIGLYKLAEEYGLTISGEAREIIESRREQDEADEKARMAVLADSYATETDMTVALQDYLRAYQAAGAAYAVTHGNTLLADEMGLGKTAQALSAIETTGAYPALIVCPANLRFNWLREINALLPHRRAVVHEGRNPGFLLKADIHIVSYSIVASYAGILPELGGLIADESHFIKNPKADRTIALQTILGHMTKEVQNANGSTGRVPIPGKMRADAQVLLLTGTPILNRPVELVEQLIALGALKRDGRGEGTVSWFKWTFCRKVDASGNTVQNFGHTDYSGRGTDADAARLHNWLRATCMVRRNKKEVLKDLPDKVRSTQFISLDTRAKETYERMAREGAELAAQSSAEAIVYLNKLRAAIGTSKIEMALEWADDFLSTGKQLIMYAIHKDVQRGLIDGLQAKGYEVVHILGAAGGAATEEAKRAFQAHEADVIVLSLAAASTGHTLTAASDVFFTEIGWNPGTHSQGEDRAHRIGQKDSVTAWYFTAMDTIDQWMSELVQAKAIVVDAVNDGKTGDDDEQDIFAQVLEKTLSTYGSRKTA